MCFFFFLSSSTPPSILPLKSHSVFPAPLGFQAAGLSEEESLIALTLTKVKMHRKKWKNKEASSSVINFNSS